jgi:hypothetical protein
MTPQKKRVGGIGTVILGLMEVAEKADFIKSHLPDAVAKMDLQPFIFTLFIALILWIMFSPDHAESHASEAPQASATSDASGNSNENAGNASATGGNAVAKLADLLVLGDVQIPQPVLPPKPKRKPNILPKKGEIIWADSSVSGNALYRSEKTSSLSVKAIIAEFRNEPLGESSVPDWYDVQASIFYMDERGTEVAHVGMGSWLDHDNFKIVLPKFQSRELVVAIYAGDSWVAFDGNEVRKLSEEIRKAKIILHGSGTGRDIALPYSLEMDLRIAAVGSLISLTPL